MDLNSIDDRTIDSPTAIAAVFADRDSARAAIHRLHDDGFHDTWIGLARADDGGLDVDRANWSDADAERSEQPEPRVAADNWFSRLLGEGNESLRDALVRHGVGDFEARAIDTVEPGMAIVTVDGLSNPTYASDILSQNGGRLLARSGTH